MKKESKPEQASANMNARRAELTAARGQLERSHAYSDAAAFLSKLQASLSEHSATLATLKARATRLEEMARLYVQQDRTICLPGDLTAIAKDVIAGGDLAKIVSADRLPLEKSLYAQLRLAEPDDLPLIKEIDFERAAVMVLNRAIELQKAAVVATQRQAIFELSRSLSSGRAGIARRLLEGLKDLSLLADQDRHLSQQLEPAEIQFLKPCPFPMRILSTEAENWFLECIDNGLIEAGELAGLELPSLTT
jgi:hypothetical protein